MAGNPFRKRGWRGQRFHGTASRRGIGRFPRTSQRPDDSARLLALLHTAEAVLELPGRLPLRGGFRPSLPQPGLNDKLAHQSDKRRTHIPVILCQSG